MFLTHVVVIVARYAAAGRPDDFYDFPVCVFHIHVTVAADHGSFKAIDHSMYGHSLVHMFILMTHKSA